ncbi:Protein SAC-1, partial [Aphelenchoides avenae]
MADPNQAFATDIYERLNLYSVPDRFYVEARDRAGNVVSNVHLEIDRVTNEVMLRNSKESPIPVAQAETTPIYGIIGMIRLVSGNHLIVIKKAELVGTLNGAEIYHITETDIIPYQKSTLHLNERQAWFNRHFLEMVQLVLATGGFYFSASFDLSHSLQWLSESSTPDFRQRSMIERSNPRFVWNRQLCAQFLNSVAIGRFVMPIIHGFVGIRQCVVRGSSFKLMIVSRRCIYRAGVRFYMRGADKNGYVSNFVESEQILEYDKDRKPENRALTAFLQFRGSIPLFWSQRPNLRWQPLPCLKPQDDQRESFISHMRQLKESYGGQHIIVNLVNTHGREKRVGSELERVATQAALDYVKYVGFDFHRECKSLNWDRLSLLKDMLANDLARNGFFYSPLANPTEARFQTGYIRANCMDCLDRTNVVQAMFAK